MHRNRYDIALKAYTIAVNAKTAWGTAWAAVGWPCFYGVGEGDARLTPLFLDRCDFRVSILGEKIIEGLGHKKLKGGVSLDGQLLELIPYLFREVAGNGLDPTLPGYV